MTINISLSEKFKVSKFEDTWFSLDTDNILECENKLLINAHSYCTTLLLYRPVRVQWRSWQLTSKWSLISEVFHATVDVNILPVSEKKNIFLLSNLSQVSMYEMRKHIKSLMNSPFIIQYFTSVTYYLYCMCEK